MATCHVGGLVTGCVAGGLAVALGLVLGPLAGSQEHVITGTVLLTCAASWAILAIASTLRTAQPQRWAVTLAAFMAAAGAALLVFAPGDVVIAAAGWVWPPLLHPGVDRPSPLCGTWRIGGIDSTAVAHDTKVCDLAPTAQVSVAGLWLS